MAAESNGAPVSEQRLKLTESARARAIDELKRLGKKEWGVSYYSQLAPLELCLLAGRARQVQYGALISWLKRLGASSDADSPGAIALVERLVGKDGDQLVVEAPVFSAGSEQRRREAARPDSVFEVNCPSVVHDHRFVVLGELPHEKMHPVVFLQPLDGSGYWYPQIARHNPLRAGRAFACFVRFGNPGGIWHTKKPPLDAKVRVLALRDAWAPLRSERVSSDELNPALEKLGIVAQKEVLVSRVSIDLVEPLLSDQGAFADSPLHLNEPRAEVCVAPVVLNWKGGAAHIEIREGHGDRLLFQGSAAPGAVLTLRGRATADANALFEFQEPGHYRVRLYPAVWSFVDPPYEWWLEIE